MYGPIGLLGIGTVGYVGGTKPDKTIGYFMVRLIIAEFWSGHLSID